MRSAHLTGIDPPDALTRRIHAAIRAQRTITLRPHLRNAIAVIFAIALVMGMVAIASQLVYGQLAFGLQAGVTSSSRLALVSLALLCMLIATTFVTLRRGRSGLGASTTSLIAIPMATTLLYALFALAFPVHESATAIGSVSISPWGARCLAVASLVGVAVLGCFASALRAAVPAGARIRSLALGSAAGAWAGLAVFVFCPSGELLHVSIGHVFPVVGLTLVGAAVLPAVLKP